MQAFQQRVVDEKKELDSKLNALDRFFSTSIFANLDPAEKSRLRSQAEFMLRYADVLGERIAAFTN